MPKKKGSSKTAAATRAKKEKAVAVAKEQELEAAQAQADRDVSEAELSGEELSSEEESAEPCQLHKLVDCEDDRCWWGEGGSPYSESFRAKLEAVPCANRQPTVGGIQEARGDGIIQGREQRCV
jgi:hypothetical protein